ncbi:hypothetical protein [Vibrio kanaloae]|uniref:hypothetical protein n=1 Tax=Vibrio kanaloae TaxID=170673 RepID=UPI0010BDE4E2|nr:hypothetical protein [Vibrio kanaloae]TKF05628.1 hypothetical protein FCV46_06495 [Vibrio kanaloae]TKF54647.1 hypothetical protein FCV51_19885 [Vibrio kanaloae]
MKRYQYLLLLVLLPTHAFSADVSYTGTYSQLNVKLCSDTPPSRSLLPSGSLVCDDNPPSSSTMCVGSWDYATTDVFNCGTVDNSDDLNGNGIPDSEEDWDGDGIKNSEDATPYTNDERLPSEDLNNNNIPDNLEDFYDKLQTNTPQFIQCDDSAGDCTKYKNAIRDLAINNRELAKIIAKSSISGVNASTLEYQVQRLMAHETERASHTRHQISLLDSHLDYNLDAIKDRVFDLNGTVFKQNRKFAELQTTLDDHSKEYLQHFNNLNRVTDNNRSLNQDIYLATNDIKSDIDDLKNSGSGGLTSTQERQLKNAAKANANQKLIKELKPLAAQNLAVTKAVERNLDWFNEDFIAYSEKTDGQFSQLSDQISAISGGQSTVDLSGVESSINSLSDKIDGIDSGDLTGVESKLDDLIDGLTNNNAFVEPNYDFDGEGFLINQNQVAKVQEEVLELKEDISKQLEKFKTLFSIDTSSFNNGTFKEHNLNLYIEGQERSFKSGVLSALLDNAAIISSVIMLLFVISGIKMLGRD